MYIHKIFHLHQPLNAARQFLRNIGTCNSSEKDFEVTCSKIEPQGIGRLECRIPQGQRVSADIEEIPGDNPNRILFRSVRGPVELAGMLELYPIRPNLTEAVLTIDCEPVSSLQKVFEAMAIGLDRFLNRQLARIEA
jgi:hypothetical protein